MRRVQIYGSGEWNSRCSQSSSGLLTLKCLEKPGPALADREVCTLKTAMKDTARCSSLGTASVSGSGLRAEQEEAGFLRFEQTSH